ncbi:MAG: bifunctional diaminohydroxyphosphoribosylaminopyrimidine deaminase/5-amino-6-(5-phosphoribosylamino)uracil reductase RibD, partial [SAR324 cluster bacterium]|nr:bifunctional diaminohydroxyphosphoribosylaminopyrimidine deaminase/5-amino-6-(5-phosphoribosylamino)uracil reductase RibD [SAR324 cluster bacterium]
SAHAEVVALRKYETVPEDAILFVTLEPCSHFGKTPPCTELILKKKVKNLIIGCQDPNPLVSGKGIKMLRERGVDVRSGICETTCRNINRVFNKHIVKQIPYLTIKAAISLDGKIAMASGESQWITGELSRTRGHKLRSQHQAIAVGSQTLIHDNPRLTDRRTESTRQPIRIVYAGRGELPPGCFFLKDKQTRRILIAGSGILKDVEKQFLDEGIEVIVGDSDRPSIKWSLMRLYSIGICSLLIEGGAELIASAIREKVADQLCLFLSGKIIGSSSAKSWTGELGIEKLSDVPHLSFDLIEKLDADLMLTCFF